LKDFLELAHVQRRLQTDGQASIALVPEPSLFFAHRFVGFLPTHLQLFLPIIKLSSSRQREPSEGVKVGSVVGATVGSSVKHDSEQVPRQ